MVQNERIIKEYNYDLLYLFKADMQCKEETVVRCKPAIIPFDLPCNETFCQFFFKPPFFDFSLFL